MQLFRCSRRPELFPIDGNRRKKESRVMKPGLSAVAVRMSLGRGFILNLMDQLDRNLIFKYRDVFILHRNGMKE
jgi:hypothetical protein